MTAKKEEIGKRLRDFADKHYPSYVAFSKEIGISPADLTKYFGGKNLLGAEYLAKLNDLGCDINWLLTGETMKPGNIIREGGVSYISIDEAMQNKNLLHLEYPVRGFIPAGNAEIKERDNPDYKDLYYDPKSHFWLEVDEEYGYSMAPTLVPGDRVLCSITRKFNSGDIVAVRWDESKGAIKIFITNPELRELITLQSINPAELPIMIKRSQVKQVYKVVLIWKK